MSERSIGDPPEIVVSAAISNRGIAELQPGWGGNGCCWSRISLAGQDVQHNVCGVQPILQGGLAGCFDSRQSITQNRCEDADHPLIAARSSSKLSANAFQPWW